MPDPKQIPLGPPLELADEDLDELTTGERLQREMQPRTAALWRAKAPGKFNTILDAKPVDGEGKPV
jgi:hypothetical protein